MDQGFEKVTKGAWNTEPNIVLFTEDETGYTCFIRRVMNGEAAYNIGHLCGYVFLPSNHPYYDANKDFDDLRNIKVHGGVTYIDFLDDIELEGIQPYAIGFDCGHGGDLMPGITRVMEFGFEERPIYRDIAYVKKECIELAKQLKKIEKERKHEQRTIKTN
jgi:hypothetical protein